MLFRSGFKVAEAKQIANWICDILDECENQAVVDRVKKEVLALCRRFPVYEAKEI